MMAPKRTDDTGSQPLGKPGQSYLDALTQKLSTATTRFATDGHGLPLFDHHDRKIG